MSKLDPMTPGELLLGEFLTPMGISQYRLAQEIDVGVSAAGVLSCSGSGRSL
jgi:plasmid maintenance system antidote protein VapI